MPKSKFGVPKSQISHSNNAKRDVPASATDITGKGLGKLRSNQTIRRLQMYSTKVKRDRQGNIVKGSVLPSSQKIEKGGVARIAPDRRWFGNTKVVGQKELDKFREELKKKIHDPYSVLMKQAKIPFSLLQESEERKDQIMNKINFQEVFGKKSLRKRPKLKHVDVTDMSQVMEETEEKYNPDKDRNIKVDKWYKDEFEDPTFLKGQSKRIWGELYKVIDSSDVIIQVLDARDPMGTRSPPIEKYIKKEKSYKHLIFVLNKCDLIPTWATARWVRVLSQEYPTLAFHASITNPFGKGSLIQLLRQFAQLHKDKKSISVGFIGYPNVGKSSVINTLRKKKVCKAAPIPGETKVWQYVTLMRKIFLIDCPGVVYSSSDTHTDIVLKSVVRIENLEETTDYIEEVLKRVKKEYLQKHYKIVDWRDHIDFLTQVARSTGKLLKEGKPDLNTTGKRILHDWQRGKIPWFKPPPFDDAQQKEKAVSETPSNLQINQLFNTIKLSEDFKFDKDDKTGARYGVEQEVEKKVEEEIQLGEPVNWDDIYATMPSDEEEEDDDLQGGEDIEEDSIEEEEEEEENEDESSSDEELDFPVGEIMEEEEIVIEAPKLKKKEKKGKTITSDGRSRTTANGYIPSKILMRMKKRKEMKK
eukprot:gene9518-1725_t